MIDEKECFEGLVTERVRVLIPERFDEGMIARYGLSFASDHAARSLVGRLELFIAGLPKEKILVNKKWPADWWQAFKERWFFKWMLKKWPVVYERICIDQSIYGAVCPHLDVSDTQTHFNFLADYK